MSCKSLASEKKINKYIKVRRLLARRLTTKISDSHLRPRSNLFRERVVSRPSPPSPSLPLWLVNKRYGKRDAGGKRRRIEERARANSEEDIRAALVLGSPLVLCLSLVLERKTGYGSRLAFYLPRGERRRPLKADPDKRETSRKSPGTSSCGVVETRVIRGDF